MSGADDVKRNWDEIKQEEKRALAERHGAAAGQDLASVLEVSRSASLRWRWPPSCSAGRRGQACLTSMNDLGDHGAGAHDLSGEDIGREQFRLVKAWKADRDPEMELRGGAPRP